MNKKLKKLFKLTNLKRWIILLLSLICGGLFIGLSFGLKSNSTKISNDYQSSLVINTTPKTTSGLNIDSSLLNQLQYNLQNRLKYNYPNNFITIDKEEDSLVIKITNIDTDQEKSNLLNDLINKNSIVITALEGEYQNSFYQNSLSSNNVFTAASSLDASTKTYSLNMNKSIATNVYHAGQALSNNPSGKVLIWKNFEILMKSLKAQNTMVITIHIYMKMVELQKKKNQIQLLHLYLLF